MRRFTYRDMRSHYLNSCGQTEDAQREFFDHITAGGRELSAEQDVEELFKETKLIVKLGKDRIGLPADLFSVYTVFNETTGERVEPEEEGMRGRSRYLEESTSQPPSGTVHRYARSDRHLYLRDTADQATTLLMRYKMVFPDIGESDLDKNSPLPQHLDWPMVYLAIGNYYDMHPPEEDPERGARYREKGWGRVKLPLPPQQQENRDRRERFVVWGYDMGIQD